MADPLRDDDPTQVGPYRLHGLLGRGGMGNVYLGRSPGGLLVAVKVIHPELADDAGFRRRFAAEVEVLRRVGGFYTAQVVNADPDGDPPWLATSYIPGPSLHRAVEDHGPLPTEPAAVLGAGLAEGLAAVHAQKLVHRDLKPANVILAADGPRVIDFGIARALDATSSTRTHTVLGTAAFMSPEQALAEQVEAPSDVFSLGCVLAFATTGRSPFGAGPSHAVAYRVVHEDPDLTGLPAPLVDLIAACLAKDPDARPDLDRVLAELTAREQSLGDRTEEQWLPDELTRVIAEHQTLVLTTVDPATTRADRDELPAWTHRRSGRGQADLEIANLGTGALDAVCDGAVLGTIYVGDISTFPIAPGTRALQVRDGSHSSALRRFEARPDATLRFAFGHSQTDDVPQPIDTVAFEQRKSWDVEFVGWLMLFTGLVLALPVYLVGRLGSPGPISGTLAIVLVLCMILGPIIAGVSRSPARLWLSKRRFEFTPATRGSPEKQSISWADLDQVSVLGEDDARLVVWPREGRSPPKGEAFQGGIVVCKAGDVSVQGIRGLQKLRGALRWFAGDVYVEQPVGHRPHPCGGAIAENRHLRTRQD